MYITKLHVCIYVTGGGERQESDSVIGDVMKQMGSLASQMGSLASQMGSLASQIGPRMVNIADKMKKEPKG